MRRPRRNPSVKLKSNVALAALRGEETLAELCHRFDVHLNRLTQWKNRLLERAEEIFGTTGERGTELSSEELKALRTKIGQQAPCRSIFWPARSVTSAVRAQCDD